MKGVNTKNNFQGDFLLFPESGKMSSRSPVTYTRSPTTHDKDDPVVIKVLFALLNLSYQASVWHCLCSAEQICLLKQNLIRLMRSLSVLSKQDYNSGFCQIRGMPYEATATEVCRFFKDCDIAGGPDGILSS